MKVDEDEFAPELGFQEAPAQYVGATQKARIWTEQWARASLFCPACGEPRFGQFTANRPAADFYCRNCKEEFELKSQKGRFGAKVVDGAYRTLLERVASQNSPNLILLTYDLTAFGVTDVMVVPRHFFVEQVIEPRKPLSPAARRAGWIGCNILLNRIPEAGRIFLLRDRVPTPKAEVRARWERTTFVRQTSLTTRGWLLEVLRIIEAIGQPEFTLAEVYAFEEQLQTAFPANNNVRPKIRQQLQLLRDRGLLAFLGDGRYRRS